MSSVKIPLQIAGSHRWVRPLKWDSRCVMCNREAVGEADASIVIPYNFDFLFYFPYVTWKSDEFSISYPVCARHRAWCDFLDWPARIGWILCSLCWLFVPIFTFVLTAILLASPTLPYYKIAALIAIVFWVFMTFWLMSALLFKPVRLSKPSKSHVVLTVDSDIAFELEQNKSSVRDANLPSQI